MRTKHTLKNFFSTLCIMCLAHVLTGCIGPSLQNQSITNYTLDYAPPKQHRITPAPASIQVKAFSISPAYNSSRIVYSQGKFIRNTYEYHRWQTNPAKMTSFLITRDLRESNLFAGVFQPGSTVKTSHTMEGIISKFYEQDGNEKWQAVLSIDITLLQNDHKTTNKTVLFQRNYSATQACAKKNPASFVEAMSSAMAEISAQISMDIYNTLGESN